MNKLITPTILIVTLFFTTYITFAAYQPKMLQELREIRGYSTSVLAQNLVDLPQPEDTVNISTENINDAFVLTYETRKTPSEILVYYKNILLEDNWEIKKHGPSITEYKKKPLYITITALPQKESENTVVTLEASKILKD